MRKYKQMTAKLQNILAYYARYEECTGVVKYVNFHLESWFTCIKLSDSLVLVPLGKIEPFRDFLDSWAIDYLYIPLLLPQRLSKKNILQQ